jgi:hypothetical protein
MPKSNTGNLDLDPVQDPIQIFGLKKSKNIDRDRLARGLGEWSFSLLGRHFWTLPVTQNF